uniref:Uncharacterized protein n=1 Tax=candidate division WOR-3 bacterium TaxID=2052148 RepID=A0A7C6EDL1_UNCW3
MQDSSSINLFLTIKKGGTVTMCCRACSGYENCQAKIKLRDDCCPQCRYFDSCMEMAPEVNERPKTNPPKKKYIKMKKG